MVPRRPLFVFLVLLLAQGVHVCHVLALPPEESVLGHVAQFEEQMELEMMAGAAGDTSAATSAPGAQPLAATAAKPEQQQLQQQAQEQKQKEEKENGEKEKLKENTAVVGANAADSNTPAGPLPEAPAAAAADAVKSAETTTGTGTETAAAPAEAATAEAAPGASASAAATATAAAAASTEPAAPEAAAAASVLPLNENEHPSIRGLANGARASLWLPEIIFEDLELVDLRYYQGIRCNTSASTCPSFATCPLSSPSPPSSASPSSSSSSFSAVSLSPRPQATAISACSPDPPFIDRSFVVSTPPLNHLPTAPNASDSTGASSDPNGSDASVSQPPYPYNLAAEQPNPAFDLAVAEPFAGQVFLLENVFLNDRGSVFDATFFYRHGLFCRSCPLDTGVYTGGSTTVYVFDHLITLAYWNGPNFYHAMLEVMPSLLLLRPLLAARPDIPIVVRQLQELYLHLFALVGVPESSYKLHVLPDDTLYFVRKLYVPAQAQCGRPSAALVRQLRTEFLAPPANASGSGSGSSSGSGISSSSSNQSLTSTGSDAGNKSSPAPVSVPLSLPQDWCVVVGQRDTTRRIVGRSQLLQELFSIFPSDRIVLFRGNLPVFDAKRLFNRARLFISPHGALMTNMVFMPAPSHVVEVRPQAFDNNCYHFLAHICEHSYYLVHGNGTKNSDIHVDMDELIRVTKEIAGKILG